MPKRYDPKYGAHLHRRMLVDMRNRNETLVQKLQKLAGAAANDATKAEVLECLVGALQDQQDIRDLLAIVRGEHES